MRDSFARRTEYRWHRLSMTLISNWRATQLHKKAERLSKAGRDDEALRLYHQALSLDPNRPTTLYNIGLIHKYRLNWPQSFEYNARAYELNPSDEAARWNYAIAATALRDWRTARRLWADNGIKLAGAEGPIEMDFGLAPLRLNPASDGEVVWGTRVDPARARIESVPLPDSGYRHGDIVLNDGAAVGYRMLNGSKRSVFNVLQLFAASACATYVAVLEAADPESLKAALAEAGRLGVEAEDWTENIQLLCKQCSEGVPHNDHDQALESSWRPRHRIGVASADDRKVDELFRLWRQTSSVNVVEAGLALRGAKA